MVLGSHNLFKKLCSNEEERDREPNFQGEEKLVCAVTLLERQSLFEEHQV